MPEETTPVVPQTPNPSEQNSNRENVNDLPQWARDAISKANNEAAKFRTERNEFRDQVTAALAETERVKGELTVANEKAASSAIQATKIEVALAAGIPGDKAAAFAARLQGTTKEELEADAQELTGVFPTEVVSSATDPSQGRGADKPVTPEAAFAAMLKGQMDPLINR